ncbi:MAG: hypothetical protein MSG64_13405 [Pyrinomonadaceae bacterium MAG19_C2-C3]|nr:hypothetical protein [Pyrinomonadaceae bacterium MAG19_C2-C3]
MKLTAKDLSLNATALELLRDVERGKRVFEPEADTRESLGEFQDMVKLLRELETRRLIVEISGLNMARCGEKSVIDKVRLRGGLTVKGEALLAHYDTSDDERAA